MLKGIDISYWQYDKSKPDSANFTQLFISGIKIVIMRGAYGRTIDKALDVWASKTNGIIPIRGIYHYVLFNLSGKEQAELIVKLWKEYNIELPIALDIEDKQSYKNKDNAKIVIKDMMDIIHFNTGQYPIIYTSNGFWNSYGWSDEYFTNSPLWIAHWGVNSPTIPKPWDNWVFWQYTSKGSGKYYGFATYGLDLDIYHYSWYELVLLCGGRATNPILNDRNTIDHIRKLLY